MDRTVSRLVDLVTCSLKTEYLPHNGNLNVIDHIFLPVHFRPFCVCSRDGMRCSVYSQHSSDRRVVTQAWLPWRPANLCLPPIFRHFIPLYIYLKSQQQGQDITIISWEATSKSPPALVQNTILVIHIDFLDVKKTMNQTTSYITSASTSHLILLKIFFLKSFQIYTSSSFPANSLPALPPSFPLHTLSNWLKCSCCSTYHMSLPPSASPHSLPHCHNTADTARYTH